MLAPVEEWRRLNARARPRFNVLVLDHETRADLNVISELRKPKPQRGVMAWVRKIPEES